MPSDAGHPAPVAPPLGLVGVERERETGVKRGGLEEWLALGVAALLHALVILWVLLDWRIAWAPPEPETIAVQLVVAPPPAAAPEPVPAPAPAPEPQPHYRESGKDQETTAPPAAEAPGPETAPAPTPPPPSPATSAEHTAPPEPKIKPRKEALLTPQRKEAETTRAPHPEMRRRIELMQPGEEEKSGDPYLNKLVALIEGHRVYPKAVGQFGLPLEGVASYRITIDRSGRLVDIALAGSSGVAVLDKAGEGMIRNAAPFPPVPADYPGGSLRITVFVPLTSDRP